MVCPTQRIAAAGVRVLRSARRRGRRRVATWSGTSSTVPVMQQTQAAPPATLDGTPKVGGIQVGAFEVGAAQVGIAQIGGVQAGVV